MFSISFSKCKCHSFIAVSLRSYIIFCFCRSVSVPVSNAVKRVDNSLMKSIRSIIAMSRIHLRQSKYFSVFDPIREWIRLYLRSSYKSYKYYRPERELSKCIIQCFHVAYPNLMRRLQIQNINSFVRNFFSWLVKFINNAMNAMWTDRFDENDGLRIGSKVAALTQDDTITRSPTFNQYPHLYPQTPNSAYQNPNFYYYYYPNQPYVMRRRRDVRIEETEIRNGSQKQSYPLELLSDTNPMDDDKSMDADASIDLANSAAEEEAEQLFNVEAMIMKTLGIEDDTIKKYTPMYCAKEYTLNMLDRFTDDVLLG